MPTYLVTLKAISYAGLWVEADDVEGAALAADTLAEETGEDAFDIHHVEVDEIEEVEVAP